MQTISLLEVLSDADFSGTSGVAIVVLLLLLEGVLVGI